MDKINKTPFICYQWNGVNHSGMQVEGIIEAKNLMLAKVALRKQGIITAQIIKKRESLALFNGIKKAKQKIKSNDINLFTRHLATLNKAGIPIIQSLVILENGTDIPRLQLFIAAIKTDVETGLMLAGALSKYPMYFNALVCSMINAGEQSGSLDIMLEKVVHHQEKIVHIKQKIYTALTYPLAVMLIAMVITTGFLIFVIPQFEMLFINFDAELPAFTSIVINISRFFNAYWPIVFIILAAFFYGCIHAYKHVSTFTKYAQIFIFKLPTIGSLLQKASIARFSRTLSITFSAGMPLTEALKDVAATAGNSLYANAIYTIREEISNGQSIQHAMKKTQLFSKFVLQMIAIGEASGTLEHMLNKIADFYEEEIDNTMNRLNKLLEPLIIAILGFLVGGLVIAMYLPILTLGAEV